MTMESFTTDDGARIRVAVAGDGPPVVLMHEWAADHRLWEPVIHRLQSRFRLYAWDARAHGGHGPSGTAVATVGRMAEDFAQLMAHFRLDRPLIVAHSMGALTFWEYVGRYGADGVGKVCILDQSPCLVTGDDWHLGIYGDFPPARRDALTAHLKRDFPEAVLSLIGHGKNRRIRELYEANSKGIQKIRAHLGTLDPGPLIAVWESLVAADYRPVLPRVTVPGLLVYGTDSNYYGVETGEYVRDAMPDARLLVYEGADHAPHLAMPEHFAADFTAFANEAA